MFKRIMKWVYNIMKVFIVILVLLQQVQLGTIQTTQDALIAHYKNFLQIYKNQHQEM